MNKVFKNDNPIHIEIGMGKGTFIKNMALAFPNINFIGIEKFDGVVARAINRPVMQIFCTVVRVLGLGKIFSIFCFP